MKILDNYPEALIAYSTRQLSSSYPNQVDIQPSGYVSKWYDQSGNENHLEWDLQTETKDMLWNLEKEIALDFLKLANELKLEFTVTIPNCVDIRTEGIGTTLTNFFNKTINQKHEGK